jgi:hypothetical protein
MFPVPDRWIFKQYSRARGRHFLAGKSHPARKTPFDIALTRSGAIWGYKMGFCLPDPTRLITVFASSEALPATLKRPDRYWRILASGGIKLG